MANFCLKKPSKRMTCRKKYKIARKIREHNRKKRKEAKRLQNKPQRKLIHVPNICPFKEEILKSAAEYKEQKKIEEQKKRKLLLEAKKAKSIEEIATEAQIKQMKLDESNVDAESCRQTGTHTGKSHKTYHREFQKVVAEADVILEVVDARDPMGTRCPDVEACVRQAAEKKRLVLVLNKADLVPSDILDEWLKYYRKSIPAIAFKCSTQLQNKNLGRRKFLRQITPHFGSVCSGAEHLMSLLANYAMNKGIKTAIRVGVVGLPNVGKSSLINSLKRSKSCNVGAVPGVTRSIQEVQLNSKIKLLDSPGLVMAKDTDPHAVLKNAVQTTDPIEPAEMVISRASKNDLMALYSVPDFSSSTQFLASLAKRYGRYKKGGVADITAAARVLVDDWNNGKISYHTLPPVNEKCPGSPILGVNEFDLVNYDNQMDCEDQKSVELKENNTDSKREFVVNPKKVKEKKIPEKVIMQTGSKKSEGNEKLNKLIKLQMKKQRKKKAKIDRSAEKLADTVADFNLS